MTDTKQAEARNKALADDKESRAKQQEQREARTGKPTPTQEENDRAALGEQIDEHAADGSQIEGVEGKHMGAGKPAPYQTRSTEAPHKK